MSSLDRVSHNEPRNYPIEMLCDYSVILNRCERKEAQQAQNDWNRLRSNRDKTYLDKILLLAVRNVADKLKVERSDICRTQDNEGKMNEAMRRCEAFVSVVVLMGKDGDLSAVDENGKKPVDHIFNELIGRGASYDPESHLICDAHLRLFKAEEEVTLRILNALMDKNILNMPCYWGYSYFGVLVLLGWWNVVRWGLDSGADVSDYGMRNFVPITAVFVRRNFVPTVLVRRGNQLQAEPPVPMDVLVRLFHPSTVNRPLIFDTRTRRVSWLLHEVISCRNYNRAVIIKLLEAGARIDQRNHLNELPMDIYATKRSAENDLELFGRLLPRSATISPQLFLSCLQCGMESVWENQKSFFHSIFCEHLTLSSGWHTFSVRLMNVLRNACSPMLLFNGKRKCMMSTSRLITIIQIFTKLGIRARYMPDFESVHPTYSKDARTNVQGLEQLPELEKHWKEYRSFVPSLRLQSVRAIRSSLHRVTDERVQSLPIPKPLQEVISFKQEMEEILSLIEPHSM